MHVYKVQSLLQELVGSIEILFDFLAPPEIEQVDINRCFTILTELSKHILVKMKEVENQEDKYVEVVREAAKNIVDKRNDLKKVSNFSKAQDIQESNLNNSDLPSTGELADKYVKRLEDTHDLERTKPKETDQGFKKKKNINQDETKLTYVL